MTENMFKIEGHLYGKPVPKFPIQGSSLDHVKNIRAIKLDPSDIVVAAYPKCGTHWIWEVTNMLITEKPDVAKITKEFVMLEFSPVDRLLKESSPRVLNSHLPMNHMPQSIISNKNKVIHVVRNPKDVLVSMKAHFSQMVPFPVTVEGLIDTFVNTDFFGPITSQFLYLKQMQEFQEEHPEVPVKLIYYEDMKKNPEKIVKELAVFLGKNVSEEFCRKVVDATDFKKMKENEENKERELTDEIKELMKNKPELKLYRKGMVGDWKNNFTVAQNERFDAYIQEKMKGLNFSFQYEI